MTYGMQTPQGRVEIPTVLVDALKREAGRLADLFAADLKSRGLFESFQKKAPTKCILAEMAAVVQIGEWERLGLSSRLPAVLPTHADALQDLADRAFRAAGGEQLFDFPEGAVLLRKVIKVWVENFSWQGQDLLGAEVLVGRLDDDALVDQLAIFLFEHRHAHTTTRALGGPKS